MADTLRPDIRVVAAYLEEEGPRRDEVLAWVETIAALNTEARSALLNTSP
jgi:hypothetical protein